MNYEQKYKEALDAARHIYEDMKSGGNFGGMEDLEVIFPELAESEDERIMEAIEGAIRVYGKTQGEFLAGYDMDTLVIHLREAFGALEKQKEQKPDTRTVDDLQLLGFIYDLLASLDWREDYAMSKEECLRKLNDYRPQKPEEWSDEDEEMLERFLGWLQGTMGEKTYSSWLKSLRERFKLQSKQGWNKEDEKYRQYILSNCMFYAEEMGHVKEMHNEQIHAEANSWLKSLCPSWKPSEEQMESFRIVLEREAERNGGSKELSLANSLYEQLKAL